MDKNTELNEGLRQASTVLFETKYLVRIFVNTLRVTQLLSLDDENCEDVFPSIVTINCKLRQYRLNESR